MDLGALVVPLDHTCHSLHLYRFCEPSEQILIWIPNQIFVILQCLLQFSQVLAILAKLDLD